MGLEPTTSYQIQLALGAYQSAEAPGPAHLAVRPTRQWDASTVYTIVSIQESAHYSHNPKTLPFRIIPKPTTRNRAACRLGPRYRLQFQLNQQMPKTSMGEVLFQRRLTMAFS